MTPSPKLLPYSEVRNKIEKHTTQQKKRLSGKQQEIWDYMEGVAKTVFPQTRAMGIGFLEGSPQSQLSPGVYMNLMMPNGIYSDEAMARKVRDLEDALAGMGFAEEQDYADVGVSRRGGFNTPVLLEPGIVVKDMTRVHVRAYCHSLEDFYAKYEQTKAAATSPAR